MESFIAGGCAGIVAKSCVAPLERVKILNQAGSQAGFIQTFLSVYQREGLRGYWKGNLSNLYRVMPNKAVLFAANDSLLHRWTSDKKSPWTAVIAGAIAGALADLVTYPLDLSRVREAAKLGDSRYSGFVRTMLLTVREEGPLALYRGLGMTLAACIPYEGIKFGSYDLFTNSAVAVEFRRAHPHRKDLVNLTCGAAAGMTAVLLTYPNDTIRRRLQTQGMDGGPRLYTSGWDCGVKLYRTGGLPILYAGFTATLIRSVPNTAIQFAAFHWFKSALTSDTHPLPSPSPSPSPAPSPT